MGGAIIEGLLKSKTALASQITAVDVDRERLGILRETFGIAVSTETARACADAELIVLAVKPQLVKDVFKELGDVGEKTVLSIIAGISIGAIREGLGGKAHVIRSMPNTPALIGAGIAAICAAPDVKPEELKLAAGVLESVGRTVIVKNEKLLDAVTGLSGSGPAYVYMIIEALADGGVLMGLDRATSLELAAQTVFGAAKMVIETGKHPGQLKDMVTSPGGTTAHAIETLEKMGLRGALIAAVRAAAERSEKLGKS